MAVTIRTATVDDRSFVLDLAERLVSFEVPPWREKPELVEGDRRALARWFEDRCDQGSHLRPGSGGQAGAEAESGAAASSAKSDEALFIAEINGAAAGCAFVVTLVDYFNERPHAHLSVLAVTAAAEGQGVGSALLDHSVVWAKARNSDRLTLSALVTNTRARALYERKGFGGEYIRYVLPL